MSTWILRFDETADTTADTLAGRLCVQDTGAVIRVALNRLYAQKMGLTRAQLDELCTIEAHPFNGDHLTLSEPPPRKTIRQRIRDALHHIP